MSNSLPEYGFLLARDTGENDTAPMGFAARLKTPSAPGGRIIADNGEGHALVLAPTGAGKKRNILAPTLLSSRNPAIVLDVKGELARETADYRRDVLGHDVHILDPWKIVTNTPDRFNPIDILRRTPADLNDGALAMSGLLHRAVAAKDPFWPDSASAFISGLIAHVATAPEETDRSLRRVWSLANNEDAIYNLAVLMDNGLKNPFARAKVGNLVSTADLTRQGILTTAHHHLQALSSSAVQEALSETTFDIEGVRNGRPMTIYICVPLNKLDSHAAVLRLWLGGLMDLMLSRTTTPDLPTLLLLDEVGQLGRMEQVLQAITLARGYGMRCMLLLQSLAALKDAYGPAHEVLLENCEVAATFGHISKSMSRAMADILGDISADALFAMPRDRIAVRLPGQTTAVLKRLDYVRDIEFAGRATPNPMQPRSGAA